MTIVSHQKAMKSVDQGASPFLKCTAKALGLVNLALLGSYSQIASLMAMYINYYQVRGVEGWRRPE